MAIRKITVLKTPKSAYDPGRPASGLLKAQIAMLEAANLSHDATATVRARPPQTEGEAARYIQKLHAELKDRLKRTISDRAAMSPEKLRAALAPRSTSTSDGGKRWPAIAGPSAAGRRVPSDTARPRAIVGAAARKAVRTAAKKRKKR
jgi:hypothetical protein